MKRLTFALCGSLSLMTCGMDPALAGTCPASNGGVQIFPDHSIGFTGNLEVDTDGAAASYSPGDHGFSYIADGVNRLDKGHVLGCIANQALCRTDWLIAEKGDFGPGTPQFCSFAISVDPWQTGKETVACPNGKVIGGGVGRPRLGASYPAVAGGTTRPYGSETSLRQWVDGGPRPIDLGTIPALVVPKIKADLLGSVVWARYGQQTTFAIVADTGPSYHEGSLALHEALRAKNATQAIGPIPIDRRCTAVEYDVKPPFVVRTSPASDRCSLGHAPRGPAEIRAGAGIGSGAHVLILTGVRAPMTHGALSETPTPESLAGLARMAGYTDEKLAEMDNCLK